MVFFRAYGPRKVTTSKVSTFISTKVWHKSFNFHHRKIEVFHVISLLPSFAHHSECSQFSCIWSSHWVKPQYRLQRVLLRSHPLRSWSIILASSLRLSVNFSYQSYSLTTCMEMSKPSAAPQAIVHTPSLTGTSVILSMETLHVGKNPHSYSNHPQHSPHCLPAVVCFSRSMNNRNVTLFFSIFSRVAYYWGTCKRVWEVGRVETSLAWKIQIVGWDQKVVDRSVLGRRTRM